MKRKISPLIAAVAVAGAVAFLLIGCGDGGSGGSGPGPSGVIDALRASVPLKIRLRPPPKPAGGPSYPIATVRPGHTIALRDSPGGQVVDRVGDRTEFGSVRVFWIEKVRSGWFGVPVPELPDGRLAWIRDDRLALNLSQTHMAVACSPSPATSRTYPRAGSAATAWRSTARPARSAARPPTAACAPPTRT